MGKAVTKDWQDFTVELNKTPESWGGANDRVVHQPIKHVILNAGRKSYGVGYMEIKSLTFPPSGN